MKTDFRQVANPAMKTTKSIMNDATFETMP